MLVRDLHKWNVSYLRAVELQRRLACEVRFLPIKRCVEVVAGVDCAFSRDGRDVIACAVVLRVVGVPIRAACTAIASKEPIGFELVEAKSAVRKVRFPYIPGLLSFREAPVCIAAVRKLRSEPDVFIIDGQGIAHPRRLGLAAHLGLFFDRPTIGCAKSRLTGIFEEPPPEKGAYSLLKGKETLDKRAKCEIRNAKYETIGAVVRTRSNVKPVFVSVGNWCQLEDAIGITVACATKYRLPEPTRLAHQFVGKEKLKPPSKKLPGGRIS